MMLALVLVMLLTPAQPLPNRAATATPSATIRAPLPADTASVPRDAAVVRNSGSTNTVGYIIVLSRDGRAVITQEGRTTAAMLAAPQTKWLFAKLREAETLTALPVGHCMRSVSFGSSTTISYGGATSPDLGCAVSPLERELARTVGVLVRQLNIATFPAHRVYPL